MAATKRSTVSKSRKEGKAAASKAAPKRKRAKEVPTKVLAFDPATGASSLPGWAICEMRPDGEVEILFSGTVERPHPFTSPLGLQSLGEAVRQLLRNNVGIEAIVVEQIRKIVAWKKGPTGRNRSYAMIPHKLIWSVGAILSNASRLPVYEIDAKTWQAIAKTYGWTKEDKGDEADAQWIGRAFLLGAGGEVVK